MDEAARKKAFERFGCALYEDYKAMLAKEDLDLVVIVTRSDQHCEMACDCLAAGKNVLVTKPWAVNGAEAEKLVAAAGQSGRLLMPWLPARWGCDLTRLKELIASGIVGKVFQVRRGEYNFGLRNDWQIHKKYAGGYLLNWGPHLVDQPMQLVGSPVVSAYGQMRQINNPGDVEDVFYAALKTADDVVIISEYNIAASKLPNWVVQGSRGTIYVTGNDVEIHKVFPAPPGPGGYGSRVETEIIRENLTGDRYGHNAEVYAHIARAVRGEERYRVSLESAVALTSTLDAIRKSSATGAAVVP
ncbi:MAG TPA: Gfo/Idh/MocA family oxidoreductase [Clostridia bacterium]|nr:Gfo/Idh/MocA family oxidoreductase [Clostridia bacterium]